MTVAEFLLEVVARTPEDSDDPSLFAGGLTVGELEELEEWARG